MEEEELKLRVKLRMKKRLQYSCAELRKEAGRSTAEGVKKKLGWKERLALEQGEDVTAESVVKPKIEKKGKQHRS